MRIAVFLLTLYAITLNVSTNAYGQGVTLTLAGTSAAPGASVTLPLSIANGGNATSAVQWTVAYSPKDFSSASVTAVPNSFGKQLTCNNPAAGQYNCMLSGLNANAIGDSILANVNLTVSNMPSANATVAIARSLATTPDSQPIAVTGAGAVVTAGPTVSSLSCAPSPVVAPGTVSCTVALSAAPAADTTVALGYGTGAGLTITAPASVAIPAGSTSANFPLAANYAASDAAVQIAASLNGSSASFNLQVLAISVSVSPVSVTLNPLQRQQFTASVKNTPNTAVSWSLNPNVGSISSDGVYTAPAVILRRQTVTVTATSAAAPTKKANATVTLAPLLGL